MQMQEKFYGREIIVADREMVETVIILIDTFTMSIPFLPHDVRCNSNKT